MALSGNPSVDKNPMNYHNDEEDTPKFGSSSKNSRKTEKGSVNNSKNPFKSKYVTQKFLRRIPFYATSSHKNGSHKTAASAKALAKETIQNLNAKTKHHDLVQGSRNRISGRHQDWFNNHFSQLSYSDEEIFNKRTENEEKFPQNKFKEDFYAQKEILYPKFFGERRSGFNQESERSCFEHYFYDESGSRINFECRKHSGIRILLRGDLLGALNCFFPQLHLVPSESNVRKPALDKTFSNYTHTYEELEAAFSLARKCRNETVRKPSSSLISRDKQKLDTLFENFVSSTYNEIDKNIKNVNESATENLTNANMSNKMQQTMLKEKPSPHELKASKANTTLKPTTSSGELLAPLVENSKSSCSTTKTEKSLEFVKLSKSEPRISSQNETSADVFKKGFSKDDEKPHEDTLSQSSSSTVILKCKMDATPSSTYLIFSSEFLQKFYPERLGDFHELEEIILKINESFPVEEQKSANCELSDDFHPNRCTYSSVLKNSFVPKKTRENYTFNDQNRKFNISENEDNLALDTEIKENICEKFTKSRKKKSQVIYDQHDLEKSIVENIERILVDGIAPLSPQAVTFQKAPNVTDFFNDQPTNYAQVNRNHEQISALQSRLNFLRIRSKAADFDQFFNPAAFNNQFATQILQVSNGTAHSASNASAKMSSVPETDILNRFIQPKVQTNNVNSGFAQNFGNILNKPTGVTSHAQNLSLQWPQFTPLTTANREHVNKTSSISTPSQFQQSHQNFINLQMTTRLNNFAANSKVDVRTIISASDLEKQAIEQYRQSEESLNARYDVLEKEAEEQYNSNCNGQK